MTAPTATRAAALVEYLDRLAERGDRAAFAALRRGLGKEPGTTPDMYRYVEPFLRGAGAQQAAAAYVVAALYGMHPVPWRAHDGTRANTSFGRSLRDIRLRDGAEDEGVTRRFVAVLDCDHDALPTHLRHLLALLDSRQEDARVDWERLYRDLIHWDDDDRWVQRQWAEGFWRSEPVATIPNAAGDETGDDA